MSCYVDPLFRFPARGAQAFRAGAKHGHRWCHLWADSIEELHAMAAKIGMKRAWFQDKDGFPHYDLVPTRRAAALRAGAKEMALATWLRSPVIICPDCFRPVRECATELILPPFRDCPLCGIGSPAESWKRAEVTA